MASMRCNDFWHPKSGSQLGLMLEAASVKLIGLSWVLLPSPRSIIIAALMLLMPSGCLYILCCRSTSKHAVPCNTSLPSVIKK